MFDIEVVQTWLSDKSVAAVMYGSQARGDSTSDSDVDVLELVLDKPRSYTVGNKINVVQYKPQTFTYMAQRGSLFVYHIKLEGRIIHDSRNLLRQALDAYQAPKDYSTMLNDIREAACGLDPKTAQRDYVVGLCRLGVYLLRTTVYIQSIQIGSHTFSLPQLLRDYYDDDVAEALRIRDVRDDFLTADHIAILWEQLGRLHDTKFVNPYSSLEELAISISLNRRTAPLLENVLAGGASIEYSQLALPLF